MQTFFRISFGSVMFIFIAGCYSPLAGSSIPSYDGASLYRGYCASCHGQSGAGDGPMTAQRNLATSDLRILSSRNQGVFPRSTVIAQIDGRDMSAVHGTREMPVWGWKFTRSVDNDKRDPAKQASARINALVDHLESIQIAVN